MISHYDARDGPQNSKYEYGIPIIEGVWNLYNKISSIEISKFAKEQSKMATYGLPFGMHLA